jgi:HD-GYP domain-containing protein (c-di-GMP phosphodiesterase class II)
MLLAETLDLRDVAPRRHSETVGRYAGRSRRARLCRADQSSACAPPACCHDIGKLGIADAILHRARRARRRTSGRRSAAPELGARILEHANLRDIAAWVLRHHERLDGTRLPAALAGEEIPLEARILAVADAYEAMTADPPYQAPRWPLVGRRAGAAPRRRAPVRRRGLAPQSMRVLEPLAGRLRRDARARRHGAAGSVSVSVN